MVDGLTRSTSMSVLATAAKPTFASIKAPTGLGGSMEASDTFGKSRPG